MDSKQWHEDEIMQKLKQNALDNHPETDTRAAAVHSEVATTKSPDQKAEIAEELFPHARPPRSMRTRRVLH